ncbi:hypothetical protein MTR10_00980 [Staphylococcus agnetis]|nr:hypothetical protein [Staphylococcus agnetis]MCO4354129.1 hypothetical protein [Staphylococcus agnetis]MCO4358784.1 hypothetical protein [Staphylococcus agnetis]MCO4363481.1 hypothetical protein [Staphylococcus agnetis]MCO4370648.1 hypothetical protein [Staphylococcus agnetis]
MSICLSIVLAVAIYLLFESKTLLLIIITVLIIQHLVQGIYIKHLEKHYKELIKEI